MLLEVLFVCVLETVPLSVVFQKRQFASRSGPFNCQDKTFCELFPDIVEVWIDEIQVKHDKNNNITYYFLAWIHCLTS